MAIKFANNSFIRQLNSIWVSGRGGGDILTESKLVLFIRLPFYSPSSYPLPQQRTSTYYSLYPSISWHLRPRLFYCFTTTARVYRKELFGQPSFLILLSPPLKKLLYRNWPAAFLLQQHLTLLLDGGSIELIEIVAPWSECAAGNTRWIGQDRRINVAESAMSIWSTIGKGSFAEKEQKNEILIMRGLIYNLSMNIINNYRCSSPIRLLLLLVVSYYCKPLLRTISEYTESDRRNYADQSMDLYNGKS